MTPPNIYISTPCHSGKVDINYHASMMMTMKFLGENRIQHMFNYAVNTGIDAARSKHATEFLASPCTHLMMIDDDMVWAPDLIIRLIDQDVDIIGVPYRKKTIEPVRFTVTHSDNPERKSGTKNVIKVDGLGTGMLLVKRQVFETLKDKVPAIQYNKDGPFTNMFFHHAFVDSSDLGGKTYVSEDYNFCRLARENGFSIWAYIDEEVGHMGGIGFRGDYATLMEQNTNEKYHGNESRIPLRFIGSAFDEVYELPLECEVNGVKKIVIAQGYRLPTGLLIPKDAFKNDSADSNEYIAMVKKLYNTEDNESGLMVYNRKVV